jgi:hypothetical protein
LDDYKPRIPHEYQFNLDTDAGRGGAQADVGILKERVR